MTRIKASDNQSIDQSIDHQLGFSSSEFSSSSSTMMMSNSDEQEATSLVHSLEVLNFGANLKGKKKKRNLN